MRVGLLHIMTLPKSTTGPAEYTKTLERILFDPYFGAVEINPPADKGMISEVRDMLKKSDFDVILSGARTLYTNDLDLNSLDETERMKAVDAIKSVIEMAAELEVHKVHFVSGKQVSSIYERPKAIKVLIKSLKEICSFAEKVKDIEITFEIHDYNIDRKRLIGPSIDARRVAKAIRKDFDNFGLMHDLSHFPLIRETSYSALNTVKKYLNHIHVGNCVVRDKSHYRYGDTHPMFSISEGEIGAEELAEFLEVLFAIGYLKEGSKPSISIEILTWEGEDPEDIISNAKETLNKAWEMVIGK